MNTHTAAVQAFEALANAITAVEDLQTCTNTDQDDAQNGFGSEAHVDDTVDRAVEVDGLITDLEEVQGTVQDLIDATTPLFQAVGLIHVEV